MSEEATNKPKIPMVFRLVAVEERRAPTTEEYLEAGRRGLLPPPEIRVCRWEVHTAVKPTPGMELELVVDEIVLKETLVSKGIPERDT